MFNTSLLKSWSRDNNPSLDFLEFDNFYPDVFFSAKPLPKLRVDIQEKEDSVILKADLPGVEQKDVHIDLSQNNILTISCERKSETNEDHKNYQRQERTYGKLERKFTLPDNINKENIDAKLTNGVLTLTLPKLKVSNPKKIEINVK